MRLFAFLLCPLALVVPAAAQQGDKPRRVAIELRSFAYVPSTITLDRGRSYVLHFVNMARGSHNFVATAFFDAALVAPADRALVARGEVELRGGETMDIHLTAPAPGHYKVHCSHFMHTMLGMAGEIVVS